MILGIYHHITLQQILNSVFNKTNIKKAYRTNNCIGKIRHPKQHKLTEEETSPQAYTKLHATTVTDFYFGQTGRDFKKVEKNIYQIKIKVCTK